MVAEKDKISLIMQRDHTSGLEIWYLREQSRQHSSNPMSQHSVKVVHYEFWIRLSGSGTVIDDFVSALDTRDPKSSSWTVWQVTQDQRVWLSMFLIPEHQISKSSLLRLLYHCLNLMIFALVVFNTRKC